ncbi:MAG: hypothetical protein QWI36_03215 [Wolbachia endosymbiont of Tyrophagus putrescentiae]|nr:hypothetical protein [Wolbachia endosymbiont of Tyrophagus putrescentiae]
MVDRTENNRDDSSQDSDKTVKISNIRHGSPKNYGGTEKHPAQRELVKNLGDQLVEEINSNLIGQLNTGFQTISSNIDSTNKNLEKKITELQNSLNTDDDNGWNFF